jgi:hypothetical protein
MTKRIVCYVSSYCVIDNNLVNGWFDVAILLLYASFCIAATNACGELTCTAI